MKFSLFVLFFSQFIYSRLPDDFQNTEKIKWFEKQISKEKDFSKINFLKFRLGQETLYSGKNDSAIRIFKDLRETYIPSQIIDVDEESKQFKELVNYYIGLSYFRMGEVENCVELNNNQSCIFPISKKAEHIKRSGSLHAIKTFKSLLKIYPNNLESKWLLNLAYNTIGKYPDEVPKEYLIDPKNFESENNYPKFEDKSILYGINYFSLAGGVVVDDFNNDGRPDIFFSSVSEKNPFKVYLNQGDKFIDVTEKSSNQEIKGSLNIFSTDFNNDGKIDIFLTRGAWRGENGNLPGILLEGNGDGSFKNITKKSNIKTRGPTQSASWGDFDNDGLVDLVIAYESEKNHKYPIQLWKNFGNGIFKNIAHEVGLDQYFGFYKSIIWGDINNDGLQDLLISNLDGSSILLLNRGKNLKRKWSFQDISTSSGVVSMKHSFPAWFFDYDNDGYEDIIIFPYKATMNDIVKDFEHKKNNGEKIAVFHNNHNQTFTNVSSELNLNRTMLAMGANFGDINNDGYLDFYVGTGYPRLDYLMPNRMFLNSGGKKFYDITTASDTGHLQKGHAVAFADLNNDGFLDLIINQGGFFESDAFKKYVFIAPKVNNNNNWINLKLIGNQSNRLGIGARIKISFKENGITRNVYRTVNSGGSFGSNPFEQHIGIGSSNKIDQIQIFWPKTKIHQEINNPSINNKLLINEP